MESDKQVGVECFFEMASLGTPFPRCGGPGSTACELSDLYLYSDGPIPLFGRLEQREGADWTVRLDSVFAKFGLKKSSWNFEKPLECYSNLRNHA